MQKLLEDLPGKQAAKPFLGCAGQVAE